MLNNRELEELGALKEVEEAAIAEAEAAAAEAANAAAGLFDFTEEDSKEGLVIGFSISRSIKIDGEGLLKPPSNCDLSTFL